ncbi:MAG: NUDIX hydrolase [Alphaproteobacteria bacterium]
MSGTDKIVPRPAVGVVVLRRDSVLLIRRKNPPRQGHWSIPGGRQEAGETIRETAVREVREETGIEITLGPLLDVIDGIFHDEDGTLTHHMTLIDFVAEALSGDPQAGDDASEARFVPLSDLGPYDLWAETDRIIRLGAARLGA